MKKYEKELEEIRQSLEKLEASKKYDVEKFLYSTKHLVSQLEYFYCEFVPEDKEAEKVFYIPKIKPLEHQLAYINIGRGFPKELMDGHWCYILKDYGYKLLVIPCTSIKKDSKACNPLFEKDIKIVMNHQVTYSRLRLTDMRSIDIQRLDVRKKPCKVLSNRYEIIKFVLKNIF